MEGASVGGTLRGIYKGLRYSTYTQLGDWYTIPELLEETTHSLQKWSLYDNGIFDFVKRVNAMYSGHQARNFDVAI